MKLTSNSQLIASLIAPQQRRAAVDDGQAKEKKNPVGLSHKSLKDMERAQKIEDNLIALKKTQSDLRAKNIAKLRETLGVEAVSHDVIDEKSEVNSGALNGLNPPQDFARENFTSSKPAFIKLGQVFDIKV